MEENQVLEKLSDKKRQLSDNFATTKKNQKTNKIIRICIYTKEVVATFLVTPTPIGLPPLMGCFAIFADPSPSTPLLRDN